MARERKELGECSSASEAQVGKNCKMVSAESETTKGQTCEGLESTDWISNTRVIDEQQLQLSEVVEICTKLLGPERQVSRVGCHLD